MTQERWNDDRLDKLAEAVEANSRQIAANADAISQLINVMREQQESNTEIFQVLIQEIRGLRAENRRIVTHLFGEQQSQ